MRRDLILCGSPFFKPSQRKTRPKEQSDCGSNCTMLFDNPFGHPVGRPWTLDQISINGPDPRTVFLNKPSRVARRRIDGMFGRENKPSAGTQCAINRRQKTCQVFDVVKRQGTENQIKTVFGQLDSFEIVSFIHDPVVRGRFDRSVEHVFGYIETENAFGTLLTRPSAEPSKPATKVEDPSPL